MLEVGPRLIAGVGDVRRPGWDRHQANRLNELQRPERFKQSRQRFRLQTVLGLLRRKLDLNVNGENLAERAGCIIETRRNSEGINRVDGVKQFSR